MLLEFIEKTFKFKPSTQVFKGLCANTCLYLVGATGAFEYQRYLKEFQTTESAKNVRLGMSSDCYFMLNIKLFLLHLSKTRRDSSFSHNIKMYAKSCSIPPKEAKYISELYYSDRNFYSALRKYGSKFDSIYTSVREVNHLYAELYEDILKHCKFKAYKKLRFICSSHGFHLDDMVAQLVEISLQAFYKGIPFQGKSKLHILNYVRSSITRRCENIIETYTTKKRGRLVCDGVDKDGIRQFSSMETSESFFNRKSTSENFVHIENLNIEDRSIDTFEFNFSTIEIINSVSGKKRALLLILLGDVDLEFTAWLLERGYIDEGADNTNLQDSIDHAEFLDICAVYLNVKRSKVTAFLKNVGIKLGLAA